MFIELKQQNLSDEIKNKTLKELKKVCENCFNCDLSQTRNKVVFSDGSSRAKIMLIGEAPGAEEDKSGIPFVGRAGLLLDQFFQKAGIDRKNDVYICNTIKCRPPENRVPTGEEKQACKTYLEAQISIIIPKIIILCGSTAASSFLNEPFKISQIRGQWFEGPLNSLMMPVFHPSYLLRNHSMDEGSPRNLMLQDLIAVKNKAAAV